MNTFAEFMVIPELNSYQKKNFLGQQKIIYSDYLKVCALVYENAALVGNSLREKRELLGRLINTPTETFFTLDKNVIARNESITPKTMASANESKADYIRVNSFSWFIAKSELTKFQLKNTTMGFSDTFFTLNALELIKNEKAETEIKKLLGQNITFDETLISYAISLCKEGFIYGLNYPKSTTEMYRKTYEMKDVFDWRKLHRGALIFGFIDPNAESIPIAKKEYQLLNYLRKYIKEYIPDLDSEFNFRN
ncbi:hypothetical protein M1N90_01855 [Dehalococcoidia bacterium]|nr:hypothetical protein [Dehalococcoidia bacterium]